jgi:hypothetical protein
MSAMFQSTKSGGGTSGGGSGSGGGTGSGGSKRRTHADQIPDSEKPFSCECELKQSIALKRLWVHYTSLLFLSTNGQKT